MSQVRQMETQAQKKKNHTHAIHVAKQKIPTRFEVKIKAQMNFIQVHCVRVQYCFVHTIIRQYDFDISCALVARKPVNIISTLRH